jgi:hypothetical protein
MTWDDVDVVAEDGRFRAVIMPDRDAEAPESDGGPIVLRRVWDRATEWFRYAVTSSGETPTTSGYGWDPDLYASHLAERLTRAEWAARYMDTSTRSEWDAVETVLRREGATDHATMTAAGDRSATEYVAVTFTEGAAARELAAEWQAWLDGDVYLVAVQECVTWSADGRPDRDAWESVEYVGGFYGRDYAEERARDMLTEHTEVSA